MQHRSLLVSALSASVASVFLSFIIHSPWSDPNFYSDIGSFWLRSGVQLGQVPYLQYFFEYPPVSGAILYLARVLGGGSYDGYFSAFGAFSLAAAAGIAWSCWRIARALGSKLNPLYFFLPSMLFYGVYNFDLFNALFVILSVQFFLEGRRDASAVSLALSVATKLVGVVLLPLYILELKDNRQRLRYLAVSAAIVVLIYLPVLLFASGYVQQFLSYYSTHGLEDAWYVWIFQTPFSKYAGWFGLALSGALLLRVYTLKIPLVPRLFLALAGYLLGATIYAPQYSVMLIPLVVVLAIEDPSLYAWEVFNALIILTWFLPGVTNQTYPWTLPQTMALLRTASLAWLCVALLRKHGVGIRDVFRLSPRGGTLLDLPVEAQEEVLAYATGGTEEPTK